MREKKGVLEELRKRIGFYEPVEVKEKGKKKIMWTVTIDKEGYFDCDNQFQAQVLSMLAEIQEKLGITKAKEKELNRL